MNTQILRIKKSDLNILSTSFILANKYYPKLQYSLFAIEGVYKDGFTIWEEDRICSSKEGMKIDKEKLEFIKSQISDLYNLLIIGHYEHAIKRCSTYAEIYSFPVVIEYDDSESWYIYFQDDHYFNELIKFFKDEENCFMSSLSDFVNE